MARRDAWATGATHRPRERPEQRRVQWRSATYEPSASWVSSSASRTTLDRRAHRGTPRRATPSSRRRDSLPVSTNADNKRPTRLRAHRPARGRREHEWTKPAAVAPTTRQIKPCAAPKCFVRVWTKLAGSWRRGCADPLLTELVRREHTRPGERRSRSIRSDPSRGPSPRKMKQCCARPSVVAPRTCWR